MPAYLFLGSRLWKSVVRTDLSYAMHIAFLEDAQET